MTKKKTPEEKTPAARTPAKGCSPISGTPPPKKYQFGQPNGNKPGRGFFKAEDTARARLGHMIKLTEGELYEIAMDKGAALFDRRLAASIRDGKWSELQQMINQVEGYPKQSIEQTTVEFQPLIDLTDRKAKVAKAKAKAEKAATKTAPKKKKSTTTKKSSKKATKSTKTAKAGEKSSIQPKAQAKQGDSVENG